MIASLLSALLGVCLIVAPGLFHYDGSWAAAASRIIGPLIVAISTLSIWTVMSAARWGNVVTSVTLLSSPLWLTGEDITAHAVHFITGLLVLGLNLIERRPATDHAGGWKEIWKPDRENEEIRWS